MSPPTFAIPPLAVNETRPFWEFAAMGEFRMQACARCELVRWPPGPLCPACWEAAHQWREVERGASLQSWVVYHRRFFEEFETPYVVALGELDAGPRFAATLWGGGEKQPFRGMRLTVALTTAAFEISGLGRAHMPVFEEA
jgi:hypothetical protein